MSLIHIIQCALQEKDFFLWEFKMAFAAYTEIFVLALALMYTRTAAAPGKFVLALVIWAVETTNFDQENEFYQK